MKPIKTVLVPMQDGVALASDIYLPSGDGPWPSLLFRIAYGRFNISWSIAEMLADGYAVISQDVRGTGDSEGELSYDKEGADGAATVEWLIKQAWCNGQVGAQGMSYSANVQWMTAIQNPNGLVTASPMSAGSAEYVSRGVLSLDMLLWYAGRAVTSALKEGTTFHHPFLLTLKKQCQALNSLEGVSMGSPQYLEQMSTYNALREHAASQYRKLISQSPYEMVELIAKHLPRVRDIVENPSLDSDYWQRFHWRGREHQVTIPMLHWGGWFDVFIRSVFINFQAIPADRPFQKLIIAPIDHNGFVIPSMDKNGVGEQLFPFNRPVENWLDSKKGFWKKDILRSWFDFWMKGKGEDITQQAPITLFVMGANYWRDEWEWPLARTQWQKLYLDSEGKANTANGDGRLVLEPAKGSEPDKYTYDPSNPVPSRGGAVLGLLETAGSFDHQDIEQRQDILVYTMEPLAQDLEVTGPVLVSLWANTSAVDTDFTAKLLDVCEDGKAFNICDGVTRLRFRENKPGLVTPGEAQQVEIELAPTSYVFFKGHSIRLEISSSAFPQFDPNPNTGKSLALDESGEKLVARQTIYHQPDRQSFLTLPVIPIDETR